MKIVSDNYVSPFSNRYGSPSMRHIFSDQYKYTTWRMLWVYLAEAERDLGVGVITQEQINQMTNNVNNVDMERAAAIEMTTHHDVMAHIKLFGEQCPGAKPIIHLGATSCFVTDNTEIMQMRDALRLLKDKITQLLRFMCTAADICSDMITTGYTHFQPAQPTTVGKRMTLWAQDLLMDLEDLSQCIETLRPLGCRGATGTSASFMCLFDGDIEKVEKLEDVIIRKMGFSSQIPVCGQTYTRKQDAKVMNVLSGIAQSASKFAHDIRLLSHTGEITEPFESGQVGSSAMPYKRNPVMCENICSLSRFVICGAQNAAITASTQWLERSLDDSANRRVIIPEMFLAVDSIIDTYERVFKRLVVHNNTIAQHLKDNANVLGSEEFLIKKVLNGGDRQTAHEEIRSGDVSSIDPAIWTSGAAEHQTKKFVAATLKRLDELS